VIVTPFFELVYLYLMGFYFWVIVSYYLLVYLMGNSGISWDIFQKGVIHLCAVSTRCGALLRINALLRHFRDGGAQEVARLSEEVV